MKKLFLPIFALCFSAALFAANTAGTLTFKVTTVSASPLTSSHIQAIWIKNSAGTYVNTLLAYNKTTNIDHLKLWAPTGSAPSYTNALTGATTSTFGALTETWIAKDVTNTVVADGTYTIWMQAASDVSHSTYLSASSSWTFAKGPTAIPQTTQTGTTNFTNVSIQWAPVNTAINDVEMDKYYSVYPNPAVSSIFVSGSDVKQVEICSLAGQSLIVSNQQQVNISSLPKGNYLAIIRANNGTIVKKIQKQ